MNGLTTTAVTVNGVRSPVLNAGAPDASEAMVFVHGNPGPKEDWEDLLRRAGEFGRAVAPDMPGYGAADKPADFGYTSDGYAKHLAGILEQLGIEPGPPRDARLRGGLGARLGGPASRCVRQRHPHQHRSVARLQMASPGQDLADAWAWGDVHGDYQQARVPHAAEPRQPASARACGRSPLRGFTELADQTCCAEALPSDPGIGDGSPPRTAARTRPAGTRRLGHRRRLHSMATG